MLRLSLRQILMAVVAVAIGLSIWRLPKGSWVDIPLATLGFYFVLSLARRALATRRRLRERADLSRQQRWGGRLLVVALSGTALAVVIGLIFSYGAAAGLVLTPPAHEFLDYVQLPQLPRDLTMLAMLVAIGLGTWQGPPAKATPLRQKIFGAVAAVGLLLAIILYWAEHMLIIFLVYLAISGVEMYQSPRFLPPELNVSTVVRFHRFALGGLAGVSFVLANLLLIGGLVKWWSKPRWRWLLTSMLAAGLAAECWLTWWIAVPGLGQLAPAFQQSIPVPPRAGIVVVASMVVLAAGAFAWRLLAKGAPVESGAQVLERPLFFHENWLGSLLVGIVSMAWVLAPFVEALIDQFVSPILSTTMPTAVPLAFDLQTLVWVMMSSPAQFIWLAAAIGGLSLGCFDWRRRAQSLGDSLPCVNPAQFGVTLVSVLIVAVASAPIGAAVSFSFLFVRFGIGW